MTFWPRFSFSGNDWGLPVKAEDIWTLRPAPGTELDAVLAAIVRFDGEALFAKFCQDA